MKRALKAGFAVVAGEALARRAGALLTAGVLLSLCAVPVVVSLLTAGPVAPLISLIIETAAFVVATLISFSATGHREALVRSRLERYLAPAVVRRILERPGMLKLS